MTLRTFAGLGALLPSRSARAPYSKANAGAGDALAALLCQTPSGLALCLVMGASGRQAVYGVPAALNERSNDL